MKPLKATANKEGFVQVISKEIIKPSSQTQPLHPKRVTLSYLDKFLSHLYVPLIFFYEADESTGLTTSNHPQISQRLKQSLLNILPSFYPLAGRLKNNISIECNDDGVEFVEARVHAPLRDSICRDDRLKQYLPSYCNAFNRGNQPRPILVVQITFFDCGGLVVATGFSHAIADMASSVQFLHAWASSFREEFQEKNVPQTFGTADYFPALNNLLPFCRFHRLFASNENYTTKRFVFNKEKIDILRKAATSPSESSIKNPSRVELISAFIWKHFMAARLQNKHKAKKIYAAFHAVNLRPRTTPPRLLENVFGNCAMIAIAYAACHASADKLHLHELVGGLRRSIERVRGNYITKPMNKDSFLKDLFKMGFLTLMGKLEWCFFTSWRGFRMYDLDFGWGKPVWFATPSMPAKNLIILVSSKSGDDVEAIVTMMPDDLQILEAQIKLLSISI